MSQANIRRAAVIGLILTALLSPAAFAYNQAIAPPPDPNAPTPCLNTDQSPCVEWRKTAQNLSIIVDVYMSYLLSNEEVDLKSDFRNTFTKWNEVPARNPFLEETTSTSDEEIWATTEPMSYYVYGYTDIDWGAAPGYKINHAVVKLNSSILWNRSYNFDCIPYSPPVCNADARKVSMHEMGHAEGLGHQAPNGNVAVMKQGPLTYWWPRADDHNGIIYIYGAYP